jgi:hypothetical protein
MKAELQAQLHQLNAQEENEKRRQAQREQLPSRLPGRQEWQQQGYSHSQAGPSSLSSTSTYRRSDGILPTWATAPHSHQLGHMHGKWTAESGTDATSTRTTHSYSHGHGHEPDDAHADCHALARARHAEPASPTSTQGTGAVASAGPSNGGANDQAVEGQKQKTGRGPKQYLEENGNPQKRRTGRPSKADREAAAAALADGSLPLPAPAGPSGGVVAPGFDVLMPASQVANGAPPRSMMAPTTGEVSQDAASALASLALSTAGPSITADSGTEGETRPPKVRKPYTIRRHPDGTPVAERFKKRSSGITPSSGSVAGPQGAFIEYTAPPGSDSETLASHHDRDAIGEFDPDSQPIAGPSGTQGSLPVAQALSQGPAAAINPAEITEKAKQKNAKLSESMKRRWERYRQEKAAALAPLQLADPTAPNANAGPSGMPLPRPIAPAVIPNGPYRVPGRPPLPGSAGKATPKQRADELRKKAQAHKLTVKRWSIQHAALAGGGR